MRNAYILILLIATGVFILTGALMALLIGLVLPRSMLDEEIEGGAVEKKVEEVPAELERRNSHRSYGYIDDYNWLVSISFLRYRDIPTSLEFFCSGVIISRNKVLTANGCYRETFTMDDFKYASIRSHSTYFGTGGSTHSVRNVQKSRDNLKPPYNEIYLVEVKPSFNSKTNIPILITTCGAQAALEALSEGAALVLNGWGGTQVPTEHILKYEPFFVQRWFPAEYVDCNNQMCRESKHIVTTCCKEAVLVKTVKETNRINTRPLVAIRRLGPPLLIGMQADEPYLKSKDQVEYFIDFGDPMFVEWLKETLPDLMVEDTKNVKHEFEQLVLYNKVDFDAYSNEKSLYAKRVKSRRSVRNVGEQYNGSRFNDKFNSNAVVA